MEAQPALHLNPFGVLALVLCWGIWDLRAGTVAWYRFEEGATNYSLVTNIVDSTTNGLHGLASPRDCCVTCPPSRHTRSGVP